MNVVRAIRYPVILSLFCLMFGCSTTTDPSDAYKGETAHQIFTAGEVALHDGNNGEAIKRFEALDVQYPYGSETQLAQLHIIYAYYMSSEFPSAEAAADRYIQLYPVSSHVDYAYFMRGVANYDQNIGIFERVFSVDLATRDLQQIKKAFGDFAEVDTHYTHGRYAPAAHQYMVYLRNMLANHQLEVAQYYYGREAYVAAINRANTVVEYYQGAPAVPQALVLMAKSYHHLNNTTLEKQTIRLLEYNFPHSQFVEEATGEELKPASVVTAPTQKLLNDRHADNISAPAIEPAVLLPPAMAAAPKVQAVQPQAVQPTSAVAEAASQPTIGPQGPMSNGTRSGSMSSLKSLMETADNTGLFSFHPKSKPVVAAPIPSQQATPQPAAPAQPQQPTQLAAAAPQTIVPSDTAVDQDESTEEAITPEDTHPYHDNGLRS